MSSRKHITINVTDLFRKEKSEAAEDNIWYTDNDYNEVGICQ